MAIVYVDSVRNSSPGLGSPYDLSCDCPTGVQEGDLLVAFGYVELNADALSSGPDGWTPVFNFTAGTTGHRLYCFYKIAGASEAGPYIWDFSASREVIVFTVALRGVDQDNPIGNHSKSTDETSTANAVAPSINVQAIGNWVLCLAGTARGNRWTPSSSPAFDEREDYRTGTTSTNISAELSTREWEAVEATGDITSVSSYDDYYLASLVEVVASTSSTLSPSVSDSVTISESVGAYVSSDQVEISVSDLVSLSETTTLVESEVLISVVQTISVSESINVFTIPTLYISVADSVSVSESVSVSAEEAEEVDVGISVSDVITLSESASVLVNAGAEGSAVWVKVDGSWVPVSKVWIRVGGTWVESAAHVKVSGNWT